MSWYEEIRKPSWAPPSSVFSVAWTIIYLCYATFGVVLVANYPVSSFIIFLYVGGWVINLLWIPLFRHSTSPWSAVWIGIILLQVLTLSVASFAKGGMIRWACLLLIPYIVWLCIALPLSVSIAILNS